jgi:hypothetical protein
MDITQSRVMVQANGSEPHFNGWNSALAFKTPMVIYVATIAGALKAL